MYNPESRLYKIGRSRNVYARHKNLSCQFPCIKQLLYVEEDIEASMHRRFKDKRRAGEWFELNAQDITHMMMKHGFKLWRLRSESEEEKCLRLEMKQYREFLP